MSVLNTSIWSVSVISLGIMKFTTRMTTPLWIINSSTLSILITKYTKQTLNHKILATVCVYNRHKVNGILFLSSSKQDWGTRLPIGPVADFALDTCDPDPGIKQLPLAGKILAMGLMAICVPWKLMSGMLYYLYTEVYMISPAHTTYQQGIEAEWPWSEPQKIIGTRISSEYNIASLEAQGKITEYLLHVSLCKVISYKVPVTFNSVLVIWNHYHQIPIK